MNIIQAKKGYRKKKIQSVEEQGKEYKHKYYSNKRLGNEYVCDFETLTGNTVRYQELGEDTEIILWAVRKRFAKDNGETIDYKEYTTQYHKFNKKPIRQPEMYKYDGFVVGTKGEDFLNFFTNCESNSTFYFHNLSFDGAFIIGLLNKNSDKIKQCYFEWTDGTRLEQKGYKMNSNDRREMLPNYWDMFRDGKKIFKIEVRLKRPDGHPMTVTFRCTKLMLSSSVEALGKNLGDEEMFNNQVLRKFNGEEGENFYDVEPYENIEDMRTNNLPFFEYCCRDVEIVRRQMNKFEEVINGLPTMLELKEAKLAHNKRMDEQENKVNKKYKENCEHNIWYSLTIAGAMRELMFRTYIPSFQLKNPEYSPNTKYLHNDNEYKNFAKTDKYTHDLFTKSHNNYENGLGCKLFRGGFTQFNIRYRDEENMDDIGDCGKWDVSSAYPFQMTKPLPFGEAISKKDFEKHYSHLNKDQYYKFMILNIKKATPKPIAKFCPALPNLNQLNEEANDFFFVDKKERYSTQTQHYLTLAFVEEEWEELQHWYDFELDDETFYEDNEICYEFYMLAAPFLKGMSEELYREKDRFSDLGMAAEKFGVKIAINSVYGSLGIRSEFDNLIYVDKEGAKALEGMKNEEFDYEKVGSKCTSAKFKHSSELWNTNYSAIKVKEIVEVEECWNIAAAAVITAKQRVYLLQTIREVGPEFFAYADTDSIVFANMSEEARAKMEAIEKIKPHEELNVGAWECEYRYIKGFKVNKAKEYVQEVYKDASKTETYLSIKGAGFAIPKDPLVIEAFKTTIPQRKQMSNEEIQAFYTNRTLSEDDFKNFRNGMTLIPNGLRIAEHKKSGIILIDKDKWTSYGTN